MLNAAVALYGKSERLRVLYPQFSARLARFRGVNRLADFTDNRHYWGHAFDLLRRGESFLLDHVPIAGRVVEGKMRREDRPAYPPRATREALANAICHRDYTMAGGAIAVAMYDEHLEIVNPGGFHLGMEPAKLVVPHESKPWNPIIANVFYRAGVIERWGMGTLKILDWCKEFDCPLPEWKEQAMSVYVTFKPAEWFEKQRATAQVTGEVTTEVTAQVEQVLRACEKPLTRERLQAKLGLAHIEHFRKAYLLPALTAGLIERTIPDKPQSRLQQYRLSDKGRAWLANRSKNTSTSKTP